MSRQKGLRAHSRPALVLTPLRADRWLGPTQLQRRVHCLSAPDASWVRLEAMIVLLRGEELEVRIYAHRLDLYPMGVDLVHVHAPQ